MTEPDPIMQQWQQKLIYAGYPLAPYGADGYGGEVTQKALFDFQAKHGLALTGQFDAPTRAKLNPAPTTLTLGSLLPILIPLFTKGVPMTVPDIAGWLNNSTILGLLRNGLISAGSILTTNGFFTGAQWEQIVGVIIMVVSAILSFFANKKAADAKEIAKAVEAHSDLTVIPKTDGTAAIAVK